MQPFTWFSPQIFQWWEVEVMMMMMNVSWQAAHQMFADALIFVKDSVFQMLLNFLELEFIWAASLPSVFSLSLCPVSIFSFFSLVPLWLCSVAQFWSGTQGTLIARLGFSLYWTLRLWQLRETYLSFHLSLFVCVCCEKWKHGKLNAFCYFQTQRSLFSILLYNCVLQTGPATKWLCVGAQWNVLPAANYSNGQMW